MYKCNRTLIWDIAYICFFVSFFISDVAFVSEETQTVLEKSIRYMGYALFVLVLCLSFKQPTRRIVACCAGLAIAVYSTLYTRDLYYETLIFVILTSYTIKPKHIIKVSKYTLFVLTLLVIAGALLHLIPMVNTPRRIGGSNRWGVGFYHSNVLPLILFYIIAYGVMLHKKRFRLWEMGLWLIAAIGLYFACGSKNGVIAVALLCTGCLLYQKKRESKLLLFCAKYSVVILSLVSLAGMLIQGSEGALVTGLNKAVTGRFGIAYRQYQNMGIHLFTKLDWVEYKEIRQVLDNGYLYVAMRYGLVFLPFYWVIHYLYAKKNSHVPIALITICVVSLTNFIDNDLNSYGYLPFILMAFNRYTLKEDQKRTGLQKGRAWSI